MKKILIGALGLACMAVACNSVDVDAPVRYGTISVSLGEPDVEVVTKAPANLDKESEEAAGYMVRILGTSGQELYKETYKDFTAQSFPLGTYTVTAENCTAVEAEADDAGSRTYGQMRLYGDCEVVLTEAETAKTAQIACTVANAKVTIRFDSESVPGRFTSLNVKLTGGTTEGRVINVDQNDGETIAWFNPSELSYEITGEYNFNSIVKPVNITGTKVLGAANNVIILVRVKQAGQVLIPEITYDTDLGTPSTEDKEFNPYV